MSRVIDNFVVMCCVTRSQVLYIPATCQVALTIYDDMLIVIVHAYHETLYVLFQGVVMYAGVIALGQII